jgi:hypothetical protein
VYLNPALASGGGHLCLQAKNAAIGRALLGSIGEAGMERMAEHEADCAVRAVKPA